MLTNRYRPRTFDEIVGQDINVELLKCFAKKPLENPRVLIFQGAFGTGKTTCARVFARALNCTQGRWGEACGDCEVCDADLTFAPYYQELDGSVAGSKEAVQELKDDLFVEVPGVLYRVLVLDEFHLASRPAQAALLKALEDLPSNLVMVFCTTDVDKIIPTIRSRAVDLSFQRVPVEDVVLNLTRVAQIEEIEVTDALLELIARYTRGHIRDALMLLDVYAGLEKKQTFLSHLRSSELDLIGLFLAIRTGDKETVREQMKKVLTMPLDIVRGDLFEVIQNGLQLYATGDCLSMHSQEYQALVEVYQSDLLKMLAFSTSEWAINCFQDDRSAQAFFWSTFLTFAPRKKKQGARSDPSRFRKRD